MMYRKFKTDSNSCLLSIILFIAMTGITIPAGAFDFEVDGIYYNAAGSMATVTYGSSKYTGDIAIPSTVTYNGSDFTVMMIGDEAFLNCSSLTSVTIPNSVIAIGTNAFYLCTKLSNVVIGNSVKTIGYGAFRGCPKLSDVTIPNSVITIGDRALLMAPPKLLIHHQD